MSEKKVLDYFYEISKIPRKSEDEMKISNYILELAKAKNYKTIQDDIGNLTVYKPGNNKSDKTLIIQSHLDIVYDREEDAIDYEKGIEIIEKDGYLHANKTTLGADNGIGVAMMLKALESDEIKHPDLILIFTVQEETGLIGASKLDLENIEGDYLINIDSEEEGNFTIGCAGGTTSEIELPVEFEENTKDKTYRLTANNFPGGHLGMEIDKAIPSAIRQMANLLSILNPIVDYDLISFEGEGLNNIISRKCEVKISTNNEYELIEKEVNRLNEYLNKIYPNKPEILIEEVSHEGKKVLKETSKQNLLFLLNTLPQGIISMSFANEDLVQTSSNIGLVKMKKDSIIIESSTRSSVDFENEIAKKQIEDLAKKSNATVRFFGEYPAWELKSGSKLQEIFLDEYEKQTGKKGMTSALHAGLECALFTDKMEDIDAISIGPNTYDVHSVNEHVEIESINRTWELLKAVIERL